MEERFYYCDTCGNLLFATIASGIAPHCCGNEMKLLKANNEEGNGEKHLPVVEMKDAHSMIVKIGIQPHPMTIDHGIRFVCVETTLGVIIRYLDTNERPEILIRCDGVPRTVYAYCNIHGLWRVDMNPG